MNTVRQILLSYIRQDGNTQARARMDQVALDEYSEAMVAGASFPPIVVFEDREKQLWLADGFHRVAAAEAAGKKKIKAEVRPGDLREAQLYAIGANLIHGLRRSNADKRLAVRMLLDDSEWGTWSNREIAERAGVTHSLVNDMRKEGVEAASTPTPAPASHPPTLDESDDYPRDAHIPTHPGPGPDTPSEQNKPAAVPPSKAEPVPTADTSEPQPVAPVPAQPGPGVDAPGGPVERAAEPHNPESFNSDPPFFRQLLKTALAEKSELEERLAEMADTLQCLQAENESFRRILDAEDLLKAFDKEVKGNLKQLRVLRSRNDGLMTEKADLQQRLKVKKSKKAPVVAGEPVEVR